MRRSTAALSLLLVASVAVSQTPASKVSFVTAGGRAKTVLAGLSKASGVALEATAAVAEDVLTIRAKDVPLDSLLAQIAKVTGGAWKPSGSGFILYRDSDLIKLQQKEEQATRTKAITEGLQKLSSRLAKARPFDAGEAKRQVDAVQNIERNGGLQRTIATGEGFSNSPGTRALNEILTLLDPSSLTLQPGQRVVFSNLPNRMQRNLPGKSQAILRRFIEQQQLLSEAAKKQAPAGENRQIIVNGNSAELGPGNPSLGIGKVLLAVAHPFGESLDVQLTVLDPAGALLARASTILDLSASPVGNAGSPLGEVSPDQKLLQLSPMANEYASLAGGANGQGGTGAVMMIAVATADGPAGGGGNEMTFDAATGSTNRKLASRALRDLLLKPESADPISLAVGEALVTAAESENATLVAELPDSAALEPLRRIAKGFTSNGLLNQLDDRPDVIVERSEAGWIVRPELPITARRMRIQRIPLGQFLRSIVRSSAVRLMDVGAFAASQAKPLRLSDPDGLAASLIEPNVGTDDLRQISFQNWNTLRVYGLLGPGLRDTLLAGGPVSFTQLSSVQRDLIAEDYFGQPGGLILGEMGRVEISETRGAARRAPSPLANEPTEVLPDGLPGTGTLTIKYQAQPAVRARESSTGATRLLSMGSLALLTSMSEDPNLRIQGISKPKYDEFQPASQTRYTFTFTLSPSAKLTRSLSDAGVINNAGFVRWDALPSEFRRKYDEVAEMMRRARSQPQKNQIPPSA